MCRFFDTSTLFRQVTILLGYVKRDVKKTKDNHPPPPPTPQIKCASPTIVN